MDGCNVLLQTQFVGTRLRVDTTQVLSVAGSLPHWGAAGERSEINIKPPLGAQLLIFPRGYLLKSFPQVDTSARQRGFEIRDSPLLGELPKAIEPHLPVCQLYRWQLGPNMWSSPTTKSLNPIVVTDLRVGFPGESHGPATCGFTCKCPEPEAWTTEASGQAVRWYGHVLKRRVLLRRALEYEFEGKRKKGRSNRLVEEDSLKLAFSREDDLANQSEMTVIIRLPLR